MSPNVDNFLIFELRIITFFLNVVLIMAPIVYNFFFSFWITQYYVFFKCSLDNVSKCE